MGACVLRKIGPWVSSPKQSGTCIGIHIKANVHYDPCFLLPISSTIFSKELKMTVPLISSYIIYWRGDGDLCLLSCLGWAQTVEICCDAKDVFFNNILRQLYNIKLVCVSFILYFQSLVNLREGGMLVPCDKVWQLL